MASKHLPSSMVPPSKITRETVGRAVDALLKWLHAKAKHQKAQLLDHDDLLYLVLTLKKIPQNGRTNPYRIPIPHPLHAFDSSSTSICLLVDDRSKSLLSPAAARDQIQSDSIPVSEVIGLSDLRSDYRPFEARRRLCDSHDLFFADRRIIPLLPRLLGKHFFKKKKIPVPVDLSRKGWKEQIRQCCGSTLLYLRTGTCSGLRVGRMSQDRDLIVENVMAVIAGAVERVPKKWANVRSFHIKAVESLALPIYQALPDLGMKIDVAPKKKEEVKKEELADGEVVQVAEDKQMKLGASKKKVPKKGRIHEVPYMDTTDLGNEDVDDGVEMHEIGGDEEAKGSDELRVEKRTKKTKIGKDATAKKEKVKIIKEAGWPLLDEGTGVADGVNKRKSKTKILGEKGVKKIKTSKVRHEID